MANQQQQLTQQIQQIVTSDGVLGVVVADRHGLCMGATGRLGAPTSGHVQSLLDVASRLSEEGEHPIVHIQTTNTDVLISHADGYTTAVMRDAPFSHQPAASQQTTPEHQAEPALEQ